MKKSLEDFVHKSGRHQGKLNQVALQRKGKFLFRDPHPDVQGLFLLAYNKAVKKAPQRWALKSQLPKESGVKIHEGIPKKFIVQSTRGKQGAKKGTLDQGVLHVEGNFSIGEKHPLCKSIVFGGLRENGKQRWQTIQQYEDKKKQSSEYQSNWSRNNPELLKERNKRQYEKNWSDPKWKEAELAKRKVKRDNRTPKQIKKDYERGVKYRKTNAEEIKIRKAIEYLDNRAKTIKRSAEWGKNNREARREIRKIWKKNNREKANLEQRTRRKSHKKRATEALNEFYLINDIPNYLWHEDEFASETDFQSAIEHVIVNSLGLGIERWTYLEELGVPDIYVPSIDLIIEVKLLSTIWVISHVIDQSLRYAKMSPTVIVSLDGEPKNWADKKEVSPWFTPEQLFDFLEERRANLDHE